jgi:hypothetical protein
LQARETSESCLLKGLASASVGKQDRFSRQFGSLQLKKKLQKHADKTPWRHGVVVIASIS